MTDEQEIQRRPWAMAGSQQHVQILVENMPKGGKAYTAIVKNEPDEWLLLMDDDELAGLRAKGYTFDVFASPLYTGQRVAWTGAPQDPTNWNHKVQP